MLKTPVLFLVFNRPDTTRRVFEVIRKVKPVKLFVAADSPRTVHLGEAEKCQEVRKIATAVDWPCELQTLFRSRHLGCKKAITSAIDWFFDQVAEGIILEDDCLPHPTFFRFCEELLEKYRNDSRIMIISGDNFLFGKQRTQDSYYFSRYPHIWGWAAWTRTWEKYDAGIRQWPRIKNGGWLKDILQNHRLEEFWSNCFEAAYENKNDIWAHQLVFSCFINNALNILPNVNLVTNIGFGPNACRTIIKNELAEIPNAEMKFPLVHPELMVRDAVADKKTEREQFTKLSLVKRVKNKVLKAIG